MIVDPRWRNLGWRHPLWDFVRFYNVVSRQKRNFRDDWIAKFKESKFEVESGEFFPVPNEIVQLFFDYLEAREKYLVRAFELLRTEEEALAFCTTKKMTVGKTVTQLEGWYQSSKALVSSVGAVAKLVCDQKNLEFDSNPQRRCVWLVNQQLHITARNLDGAIPSLANPLIVWEIKEYWGKKNGGSKMSDAVYECNLVGRELREFEERSGSRVSHIVFIDGKDQWKSRVSDIRRFIDLFHQGLIDYLFVGRDVEKEWEETLSRLLR
ncbi:MAG: hypothetical protein ABS79_02050 [Planctomycetes bacterium SCN 63-9]|nr:MAG: hypothetical protein ABS79_02050 [Planctomycetes bacterium SCN 63-9]